MFGSLAGERYDVPIEELFELAQSAPADTGNYRSRVLSVHQTGDAAVGVVAEEGYWGTVSFIDYFQLARIEGDWKIVCKLFEHTGGEPQALTLRLASICSPIRLARCGSLAAVPREGKGKY
jgi:hypothetical protein